MSVHAEHHKVRILNQLLEALAESGAGGSIDDTMVSADAEIDHVCLLHSVTIYSRVIIH